MVSKAFLIRNYLIKPRPLAVRRWEALPIQRAYMCIYT
jgi:hypothetical protein